MPCFKWHILLHSKHSKQAGWTQWETSIFVQAPFEVQTIITWRRQIETYSDRQSQRKKNIEIGKMFKWM